VPSQEEKGQRKNPEKMSHDARNIYGGVQKTEGEGG
jgi:hypothetical protein